MRREVHQLPLHVEEPAVTLDRADWCGPDSRYCYGLVLLGVAGFVQVVEAVRIGFAGGRGAGWAYATFLCLAVAGRLLTCAWRAREAERR